MLNAHLFADLLSALASLPQHGLQTCERDSQHQGFVLRRRFQLTENGTLWHPTDPIHELTMKETTRRRQPRKNSTSEISDGNLVCETQCHQIQMTHLLFVADVCLHITPRPSNPSMVTCWRNGNMKREQWQIFQTHNVFILMSIIMYVWAFLQRARTTASTLGRRNSSNTTQPNHDTLNR